MSGTSQQADETVLPVEPLLGGTATLEAFRAAKKLWIPPPSDALASRREGLKRRWWERVARSFPMLSSHDRILLPEELAASFQFFHETLGIGIDSECIILCSIDVFHSPAAFVSRARDAIRSVCADCSSMVIVPMSDDTTLYSELAHELECYALTEEHDFARNYRTEAWLFPLAAKLDLPTRAVELGVAPSSIVRGIQCRTVKDLAVAWRVLKSSTLSITAVRDPFAAKVTLTSLAEAKNYDFPMGPIIAREERDWDRDEAGLTVRVSVPCVGTDVLEPILSHVSLGGRPVIWREVANVGVHEKTLELVASMLHKLAPRSFTTFEFVFVDGMPTLYRYFSGVTRAHVVAAAISRADQMVRSSESRTLWSACRLPCAQDLSVWTLWQRLQDADSDLDLTALSPESTAPVRGVLPTCFVPGAVGMHCLLAAPTEAELEALRATTEALVQDGASAGEIPAVTLDHADARRVWFAGDGASTQTICAILAAARPQRDICVLPAQASTERFAEFVQTAEGVTEDDVLWYGDSDATDDAFLRERLAQRLSNTTGEIVLIPIEASAAERSWLNNFAFPNVGMFGDSDEWIGRYGKRSILFPSWPVTSEGSFFRKARVQCLPGYTVQRADDAAAAMKSLAAGDGSGEVTFEVRRASGGLAATVTSAADAEALIRAYGTSVIAPQCSGARLLVAFHGSNVLPVYAFDRSGSATAALCYESAENLDSAARERITEAARNTLRRLRPSGPGMLTFILPGTAVDGDGFGATGGPLLADVQLGRMPLLALVMLAFDRLRGQADAAPEAWMLWATEPARNVEIFGIWKRLMQRDVAFEGVGEKGGIGVFPLAFDFGSSALLLAVGSSRENVLHLQRTAQRVVQRQTKNTIAQPLSHFSRGSVMKRQQRRRVWCLTSPTGATASDASDRLANNLLPVMPASLLRPGEDIVVLPAHDPQTFEFWEFCRSVLGLDAEQAIFEDVDEVLSEYAAESARSRPPSPGGSEQPALAVVPAEGRPGCATLTALQELGAEHLLLVPSSLDEPFLAWMDPVVRGNARSAGDLEAWVREQCHFGVLFPHINGRAAAVACDAAAHGCKLADAFVCSTRDDLVKAAEKLGAKKTQRVRIVPVHAPHALVTVDVESIEQLRLYDFPFGDALLMLEPPCSMSDDGLPLTCEVAFSRKEVVGDDAMQIIRLGGVSIGARRAELGDEVNTRICRLVEALLQRMRPSGMGSVVFNVHDGVPVVLGVRAGRLTPLIMAQLFCEQYVPDDAHVMVLYAVPHRTVDVWTLWQRLADQEIALTPGQSHAGVFPLAFRRQGAAALAIVGDDRAHTERLRVAAADAVREPAPAPTTRVASFFEESLNRIVVQATRPEYRRYSQRINLAYRSLCLVRPGRDIVILPGELSEGRSMVSFYQREFGLEESQVIFTPGGRELSMDTEIDDDVVNRILGFIQESGKPPSEFVLVPYTVTERLMDWSSRLRALGVRIVGDDADWVTKYGHKGILHRHVRRPDEPALLERIGAGRISVPRGFVCSNMADLLEAYHVMGSKRVVVKPIFGAAGEGIEFCSSVEELKLYTFSWGEVILEEMLDLDRADDGIVLSPAFHYVEKDVFGDSVDQIMNGVKYDGWRPSQAPEKLGRACERMVVSICRQIAPRGPGGFDFLSVKGRPYLTDVNTGRFNGAHFPKLFVHSFARGRRWLCWKHKPPASLSIETFWERCRAKNVAYVPGKSTRGVFPMVYLNGIVGQFVSVGDSDMDTVNIRAVVDRILERAGRLGMAPGGAAGGSSQADAQGGAEALVASVYGAEMLTAGEVAEPILEHELADTLSLHSNVTFAIQPNLADATSNGDTAVTAAISAAAQVNAGPKMYPADCSSADVPPGAGSNGSGALPRAFGGRTGGAVIDMLLIARPDAIYTPAPVFRPGYSQPHPAVPADAIAADQEIASGRVNLLIAGGKLVGFLEDADAVQLAPFCRRVVDAAGTVVLPGYVDIHVHVTGGGGELGPESRMPELFLEDFVSHGVTTVVGVLGTDSVTRSLHALHAKCRALTREGMTAYMWTGAYDCPPPTLTDSVEADLCSLEPCIGVGEVAVSDHRGSQPTPQQLAWLASRCRVGGLLSGKAGVLYCHIGTGPRQLEPLFEAVKCSDIPISQFLPTHCSRNVSLVEHTCKWIEAGGYADFTAASESTVKGLQMVRERGLDMSHIMCSSDAGGSSPSFDAQGNLLGIGRGSVMGLHSLLTKLVLLEGWKLEDAIQLMTLNPARFLKLSGKGELAVGKDADLLLLSNGNLGIRTVVSKGAIVYANGKPKKSVVSGT